MILVVNRIGAFTEFSVGNSVRFVVVFVVRFKEKLARNELALFINGGYF